MRICKTRDVAAAAVAVAVAAAFIFTNDFHIGLTK